MGPHPMYNALQLPTYSTGEDGLFSPKVTDGHATAQNVLEANDGGVTCDVLE